MPISGSYRRPKKVSFPLSKSLLHNTRKKTVRPTFKRMLMIFRRENFSALFSARIFAYGTATRASVMRISTAHTIKIGLYCAFGVDKREAIGDANTNNGNAKQKVVVTS